MIIPSNLVEKFSKLPFDAQMAHHEAWARCEVSIGKMYPAHTMARMYYKAIWHGQMHYYTLMDDGFGAIDCEDGTMEFVKTLA